jgi:hypothetical protein
VIATALLVVVALVGTAGEGYALLAARRAPWFALALGAAVLASMGVAAAVAVAALPSALIGLVGIYPLLRGIGRLSSVRFRAAPEPASTAAAVRAALVEPASAYLPVVATRAGGEVLAASALALALAVLAVLAARSMTAATAERLRRAGAALAPWSLVLVGVALLVDGGAFAWLLRR